MNCPDCQSVLTNHAHFKICPICGYTFPQVNFQANHKPSFEETWALICEETLKKHPSQKNFLETWQWHQKNLSFSQNSSHALQQTALFLKRYPQYSLSLSSFLDPSIPEPIQKQPLWVNLAWQAFQNKDAISGLQLYWLGDEKVRQEMLTHFPISKLDPSFLKREKDLFRNNNSEDIYLLGMLFLLRCSLEKDYAAARTWFKFLQNISENEDLLLTSPKEIELLTGLSLELTQRQNALKSAINQEDVALVLENLYRPLTFHPICFDHLYHLPSELGSFLKSHHEEWKQITLDLIGKDEALRGIHLALQTVQQSFDLATYCEPLLNAQYIKAYLRPFSEIEKSDFRWR